MVFTPDEDRPVEIEGVPAQEGIDAADAVDRLDEDPDEQVNFPDSERLESDPEPDAGPG